MSPVFSALPDLGRRVERLLYFGSILLLLCFLELYFVSATLYVKSENPSDLAEIISKLEDARPKLERLFSTAPVPKPTQAQNARDQRVAAMRKSLGLPPEIEEVPSKEETYAEALGKLFPTFSYPKRLSETTLSIGRDSNRSPKEIITALQKHRQDLVSQPVTVWGIESPLILSMQYGGGQYQVPAAFVASSLFFALAPLVLAWLGSLYVTRQRELVILRTLRDYRQAFPHVLNIISVDLSNIEPFTNRKLKPSRIDGRLANRIVTSVIRSLVLLGFALPMCGILTYSSFALFALPEGRDLWQVAAVICLFTWLFVQTMMLIIQEWVLLWDKEFFAS